MGNAKFTEEFKLDAVASDHRAGLIKQRLLATGREVHVTLRQFKLETAANRFLAGAKPNFL